MARSQALSRRPTRSSRTRPPAMSAGPRLLRLGKRKVAVVETKGEPGVVGPKALPSLFRTVYTMKFALKRAARGDFRVGPLLARWPDGAGQPKTSWTGLWALPVPPRTRSLPDLETEYPVRLETWDYAGRVAEVLHVGPWSEEAGSIQKLHDFVARSGYEICGPHEEEYLTTPKAKVQKTLIRYPVRKRAADRPR